VHVSSKAEYAVRACIELARDVSGKPMSSEVVAMQADLPAKFLEAILTELRNAGLVQTVRGPHGGCRLARPARQISVADVMRAVEGPIADVRGTSPESLEYPETAGPLRAVWVASRAALRIVLEGTTVAQLAAGQLPPALDPFLEQPGAWSTR
jgi:Rrf2 family protein